ncbi:hypothetical protein GCM10027202_12390 [Microvirgula curvata]
MVNLNDIDEALRLWAGYVARREDGGLGYAMQSLYRMVESGPERAVGFGMVVPFAGVPIDVRDPAEQEKLELIERVVMREVTPSVRVVVLSWYLGRGTVDQRARDLGTTRRTLYRWVENAKLAVAQKVAAMRYGVRQTAFPIVADRYRLAAND